MPRECVRAGVGACVCVAVCAPPRDGGRAATPDTANPKPKPKPIDAVVVVAVAAAVDVGADVDVDVVAARVGI